ncbi:MAG: phage terminase large subunit family protein [Clostridiaceae bacterium]|nr:phage terminase large subunit family protein [Clostridiaceae bacterium]
MSALKPPDDLTVSEWSEQYRILDAKSSAMPGLWRNQITPYLVGIMDEFNNYETEEITFVKPTQVGGTEAMQNMLAYIVAQDPSPTMVVYPTDELGEATSQNRLQPMFKSSPELQKHFSENESQKDELQFDNMYISIAGSNSPSALASKPIKYLFLDEVDKYPPASSKEADPISLAKERTKTFRGRKIYSCSTPTLRTGHIWKMMESSDVVKHYFVPCPHCSEYIELKFSQIRWPDKDTGLSSEDRAAQAVYVCQECGAVITDSDKTQALIKGEWRAIKETTKTARTVAFWMNTLYSPFTSFSQIAKEFIKSKDDPDKLHNFANSWLAEPWEDTKLKTNADLVMERQTAVPAYTVPDWAKFITGGVDVQENSIYWTIRAFGNHITSQNIAHGQVFSWNELQRVMNIEYKKADGTPMIVALALIDSGDQTDDVYNFCAENSDWAYPCKGTDSMLNHYKISTVNKTGSKAYGMTLVLVDGGKYKDLIAARMRLENGEKSWMVHADCDREYAEQVTAEHKIIERNSKGIEKYLWKKKQSHADNHYLDCEVYAMAAADLLQVRTIHMQEITDVPKKQEISNEPKPTASEQSWISNDNSWLSGGDSWI